MFIVLLSRMASADIQIPLNGFVMNQQDEVLQGVVYGKIVVCDEDSNTEWSNDGSSDGCSEPAGYFSISVADGYFSFNAGDESIDGMPAIGDEVFSDLDAVHEVHFWLAANLDDDFEKIIVLRHNSVPAAVNAKYLGGYLASDFMLAGETISSDNIDGLIESTKIDAFTNGAKELTLGSSAGADANFKIQVNTTSDTAKPQLRYNVSTSKWEGTNDGSHFGEILSNLSTIDSAKIDAFSDESRILTLGDSVSNSQNFRIQVNTVSSALKPAIRYNVSTNKWEASHNGAVYSALLLDGQNLEPAVAGLFNLGSSSAEWDELYLGDDAGIQFGADQDATLVYDEAGNDRVELTGNKASLYVEDRIIVGTRTDTLNDATDECTIGSNSDVVTASSYLVLLTCNDAMGCAICLSETGAETGQILKLVNVSNNPILIQDTADQSLAGNMLIGFSDAINLIYVVDRWVETGRSNN